MILKSGMVLESESGIFGLVTVVEGFGTLVGWMDGEVSQLDSCDHKQFIDIKNIYKIANVEQILGKNIYPEELDLIWSKKRKIKSFSELQKYLEEKGIDVDIDITL